MRTSRDGSFSSAVVKKRCEKAGPVGDVEVCADAVVAPAITIASASIEPRM
jgi:hypothetical protein